MELVRKNISVDSLISHECGILPYIALNSEDSSTCAVGAGDENGNYGNFVCDFMFCGDSGETPTPTPTKYPTITNMDIEKGGSQKEPVINGIRAERGGSSKKDPSISSIIAKGSGSSKKDPSISSIMAKGGGSSKKDPSISSIIAKGSGKLQGEYTMALSYADGDVNTNISNRMKYMDAIRRYRESKYIMENGIFVQKYNFSGDIESTHCNSAATHSAYTYWSTNITNNSANCHTERERFGTEIADINDFNRNNNGDFITSSQTYNDKDYLILVENYDTIETNNEKWNEWWDYWWLRAYSDYAKHVPGSTYENGWEIYYLAKNYKKNYSMTSTTVNPTGQIVVVTEYSEVPFCYKFIWDFERYILGKIFVPEQIMYGTKCVDIKGSKVPQFVYYTNYGKYITLIDNEISGSTEWKNRGGQEFRDFLTGITPEWKTIPEEYDEGIYFMYMPPQSDISLLLEDVTVNQSLYTPYEYSIKEDGGTEEIVLSEKEYDSSTTFTLKDETTLTPHFSATTMYRCRECGYVTSEEMTKCPKCESTEITLTYPEVESKIESLNSINAINLDEDLYGCFASFSEKASGQMFKCTYTEYGWQYAKVDDTGLRCADGENVNPNENVYRNATIVACIEGMVENPDYGDYYFIRARYDNSATSPFTYPFVVKELCNVYSIDDTTTVYDMVVSTARTDDKLIVEYVLGAKSGVTISSSGIHYREEFIYESGSKKAYIDGQYEATLYYEKASNEGLYTEIYNSELRLSRQVKHAQITGMEFGTTWTPDNAVSALLYTKEGTEGLQDEPNYDVDVTFNRGLATAWEGHFKLSECNTMEDLENYGNNYFNL